MVDDKVEDKTEEDREALGRILAVILRDELKTPTVREATGKKGWCIRPGARTRHVRDDEYMRTTDSQYYTITATSTGIILYDKKHAGEVSGWREVPDSDYDYLTVEDMKALQSFPESFEFDTSKNKGTRLIGNSVPPRVSQAIGSKLVSLIQNEIEKESNE